MNFSTIFTQAHKLTKEIIKAGDNYRVTFGACIRFLLRKGKAMDSITLPSGAVVTRTKERDMDGYFYIKIEKGTTVMNFKLVSFSIREITSGDVRYNSSLKEEYVGKCAIRGYNINDSESKRATLYLSIESATALKDFILKRKLHNFTTSSEFYKFRETDEYKNGFFGSEFIPDNDYFYSMYEYEEEYKKTNQDLAKEAEKAKIEAERKAEAEESAKQAELLGLPKLKGTEKQVRWAEQLRNKYFAKTNEKNLAPRCKSVKTAKWWIEKRFELGIEQKRNQWGY